MMKKSRQMAGFTLVELLIVIVIVAILTTLALPQYRKYVVRAHRTDAQRALLDLSARQERYAYTKNAYAGDLTSLNADKTVAGSLYEVSVLATPSTSATAYVLTATAVDVQARDDAQCKTLTVNNFGAQGSSGKTANDPACWGK